MSSHLYRTHLSWQLTQLIRDFNVRVKLNLIKELVKDRRVVVVDDSVVRGTTARARVVNLLKAGAKEVHLLVGRPPQELARATTALIFRILKTCWPTNSKWMRWPTIWESIRSDTWISMGWSGRPVCQ